MQLPPKYDLKRLKTLLANPDTCIIRRRDRNEAASLGYVTEEDLVSRVNAIQSDEFYKTMLADDRPGLWQDVYRSSEPDGTVLYIKLQEDEGNGVIISFKRK